MINLLSPDDRRQLTAARSNSLLLRYILLTSVVIAVMAVEMLGVYLILYNDQQQNISEITARNKDAEAYKQVQQDADTFRTNLGISKYILDKQIPYTGIILAISQILPDLPGEYAYLTNLSIVPSTFGTPMALNVHTDSPTTAVKVKGYLQNVTYEGKTIFTSVSFSSITAPVAGDTTGSYHATFSVTFSKELGSV